MADVKYTIDYSAPPAKINRDIDVISQKLTALGQLADKVGAKLKTLGQNSPGLTRYRGELQRLDKELVQKVADADKAERALKEVGKDNRALTALTARVEKLSAELKVMTAEALAAQAALSGVGGGAGGIGGGKGGGPVGGGMNRSKQKAGLGGMGVMATMAGASLARAGIQEMAEAAQKGRDYFTQSAGKVAELRDQAREYASLRKQAGPNDKVLREITDFGKATGATPEDSVKFLTTYEGSATTGRDKGNLGGVVGRDGYTQAKQDALEAKLKVVGGQFAMRTGLDAHTAGDLTGVASTYSRFNRPEDLAGQLGGMHYGLDQGRGEISPLARGELGQAGSSIESGRVSGLPELGAFIGVASVASKTAGSSGTTYGQVSRFLNESGAGNEAQAAFIKESGMGAAKGDFNKLKALRDHLARVKPDDANTYLEGMGYGNSTDRRSVLGMVGNVGVLEERIKKANEIAADGSAVLGRNADNQKEIANVGNRANAGSFAVDIEAGLKNEKLEVGRTAALSRLKDPNQPGGPRINTPGAGLKDALRTAGMLWSNTGEAERIDEEAIAGLKRGGAKVGVDVARQFPGLETSGLRRDANTDTVRREQFSRAFDLISSRGGDPLGGEASRKIDQAGNLLKSAAQDMKRGGGDGGGGGSGGGGSPPPPPVGNGGAGVNPGRR